ncbi:MAG: peptide deformylase [Alphaproteobacteria bacterium CG11_big_fil_rev_8_21_14_0_20_44_7]|nr:MAG: peptide deformylase [Alphaproteobacteria bacterium CG11_big_fil_rev_8_21_14_0_20_44_7]
MAILRIITAPDPRLKMIAEPVTQVDDELRQFMDDLLETMYDAHGIGLAATQVGVLKRVLVLDIAQREGDRKPMFFINPEITEHSDETNTYTEGCLSFPDQFADVERPKYVKVKYLDYDGKAQEIDADELLATCLQHEIDHLDGKVFVDYISKIKRDIILRRLKKDKKHYEQPSS